jgi:hypothetical protein
MFVKAPFPEFGVLKYAVCPEPMFVMNELLRVKLFVP